MGKRSFKKAFKVAKKKVDAREEKVEENDV